LSSSGPGIVSAAAPNNSHAHFDIHRLLSTCDQRGIH